MIPRWTYGGGGEADMGGFISGMNYNLLFAPAGSFNESASILSTLYSGTPANASGFASTGDPLLDLKLAQKDQTADVALEAKQSQVSQAVAAFTNAVKNATSISAALANPNVQRVLLTASGLSNYIGETALVQKAFMSDPTDPDSVVNQLGDSTLLSTVQTYDFAKNGLAELQNPKIQATLTSGYAEVMWRQSLNQSTPGLSNALDFLSQASSIKSVSDVLSNSTNFYVITGALGIPPDIVFQSVAAQQKAINSRLDYSKFQDPAYVTSLTDQYLISQQTSNQSSGILA
jgi:Protein of unknown function (DUF1217)